MRVTLSGTMSPTALMTQPSTRIRLRTWALPIPPTPTKPIRTVSIGGGAANRPRAGPEWWRGSADAARAGRKRGVEGKRGEIGGRRVIKKKKKKKRTWQVE